MKMIRIFSLCLFCAFLAGPSLAQVVHDGNQTGLPPFGSFHGTDFDRVSMQNGSLHIEIPVLTARQRGRNFGWRFIYDTPTWDLIRYPGATPSDPYMWLVVPADGEVAGWRLTNPFQWSINYDYAEDRCNWTQAGGNYSLFTNFTVQEPDGTKHPLALRREGTGGCGNQQSTSSTLDGTGIKVEDTGFLSFKVTLKDGTQVLPFWRDANGNLASASSDMISRALVTVANASSTNYTSPLNVVISGPSYTTWTLKNSQGDSQVFRVDYAAVDIGTNLCGFVPSFHDCMEYEAAELRPRKLTLPNGKFYEFTWANNGHADLTQVTLPTGGTIAYTYGSADYPLPGSAGSSRKNARRQALTRAVTVGGSTHTWNYQSIGGPGSGYGTITDPAGNTEVHLYSMLSSGNYNTDGTYLTEIKHYNSSAQLLRTTTKEYAHNNHPDRLALINVRAIRETTTLENNLVSKAETDYETFSATYVSTPYTATRLNPTEKREYAFGSGSPGGLVRRTTYSYLHGSNSTYVNLNIVDRVENTIVYDASGSAVAKTQSVYDQYDGAMQSSSAINHDSGFGTSYTTRGNVTSAKKWRNTDDTWLTTQQQYDDAGNVIKITDPLSHDSFFDYTDAWAQSTCAPSGQGRIFLKESKNHLNHRIWKTWNSCTGTVASIRDENDLLASRTGTTFSYDSVDRLDVTNTPDGGQTDNDYDDTNRIVTTKVKKDSSAYVVSRAHYDVLGRVWRQEQCENGATCTESVNTYTEFDALGRNSRVTNPTRCQSSSFPTSCGGEATFGITKSTYDGLGRVVRVIPPDGNEGADTNVVKTAYSGNTTTVTDQAGNQRRSTTDALGRLIQVDEPGGGGPATGSSGSATVNSVNPSGGVQEQNISAIAALGSVTLSGALQSTQSQSQSPTQSTGTITVNGSEQSVNEQTNPGTSGTGNVVITGFVRSKRVWEEGTWVWYYDTGGVSITVNGFTATTYYWQGHTAASVATALANIFNGSPSSPVTASVSSATVYLTAKTTGAATNYALSASSWTDDPAMFPLKSFNVAPSGSTLTGGSNPQYQTIYDSGSVTVSVNGGQVVATANFGQSSTASSIAADLRTILNNSSLLIAGGSGATINLTSEAAGASTNYSLATSWTYNTSKFGSPSFTASASGANMTGGSDAQYSTVYDSGTVTITVNGASRQVSYGQDSSASSIAAALAAAIGTNCSFTANASANGATVNLTACPAGAAGNNYALNASTTWNTSYFGSPSFAASKSGDYLSGGVNGSVAYDAGTVTLTIAGCTPFTVNYANGSTRDTVAEALRAAVAGSGCPVQIARTGNALSLQSSTVGSGVNYTLSSSNSTTQGQYFAAPSFSVAVSGMSGGADYTPGTLNTPLITAYVYDTLDNLICVEQRGNVSGTGCASAPSNDAASPWRVRRFDYNSLSQMVQAKNPESGTISYSYDADGNLMTKTSPAPNQINPLVTQTMSYCYDELHRLTKKAYTPGGCSVLAPAAQYFYDQTSYNGLTIANGKGQRTGMSDGSGQTAWSYDIVANTGWKTTERRTLNGVTKTIVSQNNLAGGVQYVTYPSTHTVSYSFDGAGRVTSAQGSLNQYAGSATYMPHGALATLNNGGIFGGGVDSTYFYNNRLQPCRISVRTSGSAPADCSSSTTGNVLDFRYSFDSDPGAGVANNGNVAKIENLLNTNRTQSFSYDELNRIRTAATQATSGAHAWGYSFAYDPWANLHPATVTQGNPSPVGASPATDNRILGYCYDAAGNLLIAGACGGLANLTYTYDAENRIVTTGGVTYTYDGDGKRVKKSNGKLYWTGMGSDPLAESDLAGNISEEYIFFNGKRVARRVLSTGAVFYYFGDHLGTSRVILQSGATTPCYDADYYPFGGERVVTDTCPQNYKFTGKERDAESNLDYFGARYYASTTGRFLSPDEFTGGPVDAFSSSDPLPPGPLPYADIPNPQSLNKYTYTWNNPLRYTDPTGHVVESAWDAANVIAGAVSFGANVAAGNVLAAAVDAVGVLVDTAALLTPGVPGGAGAAIKGVRALNKADDAIDGAKAILKVGDKASDATKAGRMGKQERLAELANDPKVSSSDRGWIKNEQRHVETGNRSTVRNPPGKDLAHERGREAAKGYDYKHSHLQNRKDHRQQHKFDNMGKKNKERPVQKVDE